MLLLLVPPEVAIKLVAKVQMFLRSFNLMLFNNFLALSNFYLSCTVGVYFVVCMALLVISLTETVLIVRLVHKQDLQQPVPHWVKYLVLERAPVLFCIHKKHRLCSRLSSQASDLEHYKDNNYGTGKVQVNACSLQQ